ncbi:MULTISPECIES: TM2 domain-containing protein [Brevundimonas]|uniref:TM2 domain-containing protein n=1 Tax=Brevundimonas pishanensis TaxID=2896315 RepID=UPI001FA6AABD|nr:TM2 domain-containing protein [Brevundimonas pishanensis]
MTDAIMGGQKYCSGCATVLHKDAFQCPKCGAPQIVAGATGQKSKVMAVVLALLLGGIGAHKFYLGRVGWGIIYLLFCWTFIPSLIAFIEAIIYVTMSDQAFAQKYG